MLVFLIVAADETSDPALRILLAGEPRCWPVRPVLAGAEQGFGERVIIVDPRPAVGGDDAEPLKGGLHGGALHRTAVVGVQDERAREAALGPDRLAHELGGQLRAFARVEAGSRPWFPRSGPLRPGRDDCSSSGSSLCRPVHRPRVVRMMAPSV